MGVFDQIGDLLGNTEGKEGLNVISVLFEQEGGLNGLLEKFRSAGLAETIQSWVRIGENAPISPEQIQAALGKKEIQGVAEKLGVDASAVTRNLANILPQAVDKLTPAGELGESSDFLQQGLNFLKGKLFG
jgi:uncharacterized protein YidB (DUF937 family)